MRAFAHPCKNRCMGMRRRYRSTLAWTALLIVAAATIWAAGHLYEQRVRKQQEQQIDDQLQLRAQTLQGLIDRYRILPSLLALDPELGQAVSGPLDATTIGALNRKLERANGATQASTLTLIGANGIAIAANNWRTASSNVGRQYAFRPYFQLAMKNGTGTFYAIGVSTNVAGYYIAEAIRDASGKSIGVVVVKITLEALQQEWMRSPDTILLSDEHDIVFMTNRQEWSYRLLNPLSPLDRADLVATRQYGDTSFRPIQYSMSEAPREQGTLVHIADPAVEGMVLWKSLRLPDKQWTLHLLRRDQGRAAAVTAAVSVAAAWLPLILLGMFLRQRAQMGRQRERSRLELERMVAHHAEALRSAQDSLVQAANQAALGYGESLEHLPQGVSVVDAHLRLVAWNARYQEIFSYPGGLLQVGKPIEEVFRYNARRGWFGPGDVEQSIQRRLEHLRGSGPYAHERERADGTVLEIRGNPLPNGGFVTSYADITAYKSAARDLRTLATTLEQRVMASTRDLRAAKAVAENANRYKARFVAAAVHDLLQPLNASRLYLATLRERLRGSDRELVTRIESVLESQDAMLASMQDLSRLEAGVLLPNIESVPLAPLLSELAAQSTILAEAHGLRFDRVACAASVRSDANLLRRVLQNFIANAIHYTPRGRVMMGCRRRGGALRIEVWDTGIGIPESKREAIFEEFRRLDSGIERDNRSAGLGLSIVDRVARLLGHEIGLRSWPGRGSVFWIEVPLADTATNDDAPRTSDEPRPLQGCRVWCVDDDQSVLDAMRTLLGSWGCEVLDANDSDGLETLAENARKPDFLLLDYQLGDQTGPDLLPALRRHWRSLPTVIVLSALQDPSLRDRLAQHGLHFLPKPVASAALRALMTHLLLASTTED